ncbi:hybrid sensor histidine kinase/response regulator transcription factor [Flavobacterium nackdongense]|uniref:histidine kinase n=1 Tax=Flavobacterium nackdongense TaxID=2547394 RepID=A0A4P6YC38_9FLAO|nr:hybrid sensor histidine kinase/response regulator transcription factor [Flavobacterium nackdongense]QBN17863.1 hybrid sensor histidine kinase/response regulator [Flavobacterium nackdongense]
MKNYYFFGLLLFFGATLSLQAQGIDDKQYTLKFQHFTSSRGLSQRSVMAILQDKKGYVWFGTRDGLNKFDGNKFVIYRHRSDDKNSLSNNYIQTLYQDAKGNLWIGTQNGLNKYNPELNNFVQYQYSNAKSSIQSNIIWDIIQLDAYTLWIATSEGISQVDTRTKIITKLKKSTSTSRFLKDNTRDFLKTKDGNLWICSTQDIVVYDPRKGFVKKYDFPINKSLGKYSQDRPTLFQDSKNNIWLGYEKGLAKFNPKTKLFIDYEFQGKKAIATAIRSITEDLSGNLWVGSYSGIYIINAENTVIRNIVHDEKDDASLSQNSIYKIICDSRGDMWIGTWGDGVDYFNKDNDVFKEISFGDTNTKLNYKIVSGMTEDKNGNLWIGTEGGGLNFYDRKSKKFSYFKHNSNAKNSISANNIKSVITATDGTIWVGIHDGGVNYFNPNQLPPQFNKIDFPNAIETSLQSYKVLTLLEDVEGKIWIGTLTGGLLVYDKQSKILSRIDRDSRTVMSIVQTRKPGFLLVGGSNGVQKINIYTKERTLIPIEKKDNDKNPFLYVNSIYIDNFNHYWIGTEGQGLFLYNPQRRETKNFGIKEGLPNDIIYGVLSDNNGNMWISTNYGISRLNVLSNQIKNYNQWDGLQGNEFNYGSFLKTRNNELFFGGTNGITYFNPSDIRKNTFVPTIDINNIDVNNEPHLKITDATSEITLKYDENNFSIDFTALNYRQPEKNEFAYILEGNDSKWNYVGNQRQAVYTNIAEGNYVFKVRGSNNDGVWNEEGDLIKIKILPAPWKTWWAYIIYLSIAFVVLSYIRKILLLRIKEKNELKKERLEKEKLEEINELKLRLFTNVSHDFRTPLTLIIAPLEKMIEEKMGNSYIRQQHDIMYRNSRMLLQLINQILDFRKSDSGKLSLLASKNDIVPFIEDIKKSFEGLAKEKHINFQFNTSHKSIELWFDRDKMKKILFNLLSNAFKFTADNNDIIINVTKNIKKDDDVNVKYVKIDVINFVNVIPAEHIKQIFERFYQLDQKKMELGSGIGLSLTKSLVNLHKGDIVVNSSETDGTCFSVYLKQGKKHLLESECINEMEAAEGSDFFIDLNVKPRKQVIEDFKADTIEKKQSETLLIVEDNLDLQTFIKELFASKYNVFTAENGEQAIAIAHKNAIDLIISDIQMPIMDGFELCKNIKTTLITSHIPVLLLTAKTSPTNQEEGYAIGADSYITKPFKSSILITRVDNLLKTRANLINKFKKDILLEPKNLTVTSADEVFLETAIAIVEKNITNQDFDTKIFIEEMNMSRTVLYTKLKALTGQNLSEFIRMIRLKKAGQLLVQTQMNISQIAFEVGFNDLKYFRECFKELYELTPTEYKRKMSSENE